jgi:hypothetical protein
MRLHDSTDIERRGTQAQCGTGLDPAHLAGRRGVGEYTQLLYIPAKAPFDLWNRDKRGGVKLYVKRVFIMDDAEALMPVYLRFVKGVIDSADLPLNVSRELLQESRDVKAIREGSTKRVLSMLESLADTRALPDAADVREGLRLALALADALSCADVVAVGGVVPD